MTRTTSIPVLLIGAGPIGLLGARLLGQRGVRCVVAERFPSRLNAPKAHALNPRSLEICAQAGLPMAALHAAGTRPQEGACVRMVTSLVGREIGSLPYERQDDAVRTLTPWPLINIAQPEFEAVLASTVDATPQAEVRHGMAWTGCVQDEQGVLSTLVDTRSGEQHLVHSRYLLATDGAGSEVRQALGIGMDGPDALQTSMMIHFQADLRSLLADRPAILYFLFAPGTSHSLIAYDMGGNWVLMHRVTPEAKVEDFTEAVCRQLIRVAVGVEVPDLHIKGVRRWVMSAQVAQRYREGRAFLVGDAAHRFPPSGGLGLNTGIAEIDNLAWKLAMVEAGHASASLLDTYESERKPIAEINTRQSLSNAMRMRVLLQALDVGADRVVDPSKVNARLDDPSARDTIAQAMDYQRPHFDSLRLQLGYVYGEAPNAHEDLPVNVFIPRTIVGARLPHVALADGRSSLDLIAVGAFTLIVSAGSSVWHEAAGRFGAPIVVREQGRDFECEGALVERLGLGPEGALLVRPDAHLLALAEEASPAAIAHCLDAVQQLLHGLRA